MHPLMNHFDSTILLWLNQFVGRHPNFDAAVVHLSASNLLKGQAFMLTFWWFWFAPEERRRKNREIILATILGAFIAIFLGRVLAACLPFRLRPGSNPDLAFTSPFGADFKLRTWSSFPSDHSMLFCTLATGLIFISAQVGAAAYVYGLLFIDLPRVYLGFHHPTDVLAGAALGTAIACAINAERVRRPATGRLLEALQRHESAFYSVFFFVSIQIMTMFDGPRTLVASIVRKLSKEPRTDLRAVRGPTAISTLSAEFPIKPKP